MPIFSEAEMGRRQRRISEGLRSAHVDAAFVHTADNVYYLTGVPLLSEWGRPVLAGLVANGDTHVVAAAIEAENVTRFGHTTSAQTYNDSDEVWTAATAAVVRFLRGQSGSVSRLGVELAYLNLRTHAALREAFPDTELVDITAEFDRARLVKSEEEVVLLRHGAELAKIGAATFLDALRPGVSELDVAAGAVAAMNRGLAEIYPAGATSSYAYCHFADHTLTPHLHPTGRRLQGGDIVALNVFPVIWGYCIELERTLYVGEAPDRGLEVLSAVTRVHNSTIAGVKPGVPLNALHETASIALADAGLGEYIRHGTGHAHGIMIGASGREALGELRSYNSQAFEANMFTSIEPGVYLPDLGGFRHSDVLQVGPSDTEVITPFDAPFVV